MLTVPAELDAFRQLRIMPADLRARNHHLTRPETIQGALVSLMIPLSEDGQEIRSIGFANRINYRIDAAEDLESERLALVSRRGFFRNGLCPSFSDEQFGVQVREGKNLADAEGREIDAVQRQRELADEKNTLHLPRDYGRR